MASFSRGLSAGKALSLGLVALVAGLALPPAAALPDPPSTPSFLPSIPAHDTPPGDSTRARQYWLSDYGFKDVWKESRGKGVTVAVIDTGTDASHQDISDNVLEGWDASGRGDKRGWQGLGLEPEHGTLVASVISGHGHEDGKTLASQGWPGKPAGILGIAPETKILPISLELGTVGAQQKSIDEQIPEAVKYAVDHGADIINLSVGSNKTDWPQSWDEAFAYAEEKDVLVVASSGNRGAGLTQVGAPATIPGVLTVGGVDTRRQDSWSSSSQGISIAVAAPSERLIGAIPQDKYALWSGTSAAAPIVSGMAALIKAKYPDLTAAQIAQRLTASADDEGQPGRDPIYGFGIINPQKALAEDTPDDAQENPLGSMREWMSVHRKNNDSAQEEAQSSATPVHQRGEEIQELAAPQPVRPVEDSGILPFIVLGGFALWSLIITAGTILRLRSLRPQGRSRP